MNILTLNINAYHIVKNKDEAKIKDKANDLKEYINDIGNDIDIAVLQECPFYFINEVFKDTHIIYTPYNYEDKQRRFMSTIIIAKKEYKIKKEPIEKIKEFLRWNEVEINKDKNLKILGVHMPINEQEMFKDIINYAEENLKSANEKPFIIMGDMNANPKVESLNNEYLNKLKKKSYNGIKIIDAWEYATDKNNEKAYVIDENNKNNNYDYLYPTFLTGTHIDYIFTSSNIEIEEVIIDNRTLNFTDHKAVIIKIKDN